MNIVQRVRRRIYQLSFPLIQGVWRLPIPKPRLRGVRTVIVRDGRVLLVRHAYGDQTQWRLPGGGVGRGEPAAAAAVRETREEVRLEVSVQPLGTMIARGEFAGAEVHGFWAEAAAEGVRIDPVELTEAQWWPLNALPEPLNPTSSVFIDRYLHRLNAADA